ncbi:Hypothetical protein KVN_LOCUS397 [uncultured virus]|nr:Hypothetical protein KVN_LOCUS397 [uncultured virus]
MNYDEALEIISQYYHNSYFQLKDTLCEKAIINLAETCRLGTNCRISEVGIKILANMDDDRQISWITNPFMQFVVESLIPNNNYTQQENSDEPKYVEPLQVTETVKEPEKDDEELYGLFD